MPCTCCDETTTTTGKCPPAVPQMWRYNFCNTRNAWEYRNRNRDNLGADLFS